jgi:hypothetical protein
MQRFGITVAEFKLDVFAMRLDRLATDAKLFRDLTGAVSSRDERENRHLAIAKNIEAVGNVAMAGKFVYRMRPNHRADVNFTCKYRLNRVQ